MKVMIWNFETEQYEQATPEDAQEMLDLIKAMNTDCANNAPADDTQETEK